jgi:hypothetical protein
MDSRARLVGQMGAMPMEKIQDIQRAMASGRGAAKAKVDAALYANTQEAAAAQDEKKGDGA